MSTGGKIIGCHRGGYGCTYDLDFGDGCESEMEGINCCEAHYRYGPLWVDEIRNDPLFRRELAYDICRDG